MEVPTRSVKGPIFSVDDWLAHHPEDVIAKNFGVPRVYVRRHVLPAPERPQRHGEHQEVGLGLEYL